MAWKSKAKQREYQRNWYQQNKDKQKGHVRKHQRNIKLWFKRYKNTIKCSTCSESESCCIDFHHIGNNKKFNVSSMANSGYSIKSMMEEIQKCIPLCANCHRKETKNKRASSSA